MVKIFDVSHLADRPVDGTFDLEAYERGVENKLVANHGKTPFANAEDDNMDVDGDEESKEPAANNENEWSDDDSDDSDDSDESDMSEDRKHKKRDGKLNQKSKSVAHSKK